MTYFWDTSELVEDDDLTQDMCLGWETREQAEDWISQAYLDLLDMGVTAATLLEGTHPVYKMSLEQEVSISEGLATGEN